MNIAIVTFGNGEVTEKIDCRKDLQKYGGSCRSLKNMIPLVYGCAERRTGTKYISNINGRNNDFGANTMSGQSFGDSV